MCTNETHPAHIMPHAADDRHLELALHLRDHERPAGAGRAREEEAGGPCEEACSARGEEDGGAAGV
jgi:hypothetical protein